MRGNQKAKRKPGEWILDNPFRRLNTGVPEHKEGDGGGWRGKEGGWRGDGGEMEEGGWRMEGGWWGMVGDGGGMAGNGGRIEGGWSGDGQEMEGVEGDGSWAFTGPV